MCIARFRRAQGYNVLHPMGWDAFGLPAENAARDKGVVPRDWTYENIAAMRAAAEADGPVDGLDARIRHLRSGLLSPAAEAVPAISIKAGFVYRGEADVNWDPVDMTVLANEQVIDGRGWRSGAVVERRKLSQWFFKITAFRRRIADRAGHAGPLAGKSPRDAEELDRPQRRPALPVHSVERRKAGRLHHPARHAVRRQLCGAVAGSSADAGTGEEGSQSSQAFIAECRKTGTAEAEIEKAEKLGYDTGLTAAHPFDPNWKLPVMVANFVLMGYGTGAIFGCPAHDQRDLDFARKYGLSVTPVVVPEDADPKTFDVGNEAYTGPGKSGQFALPRRHDGGTGQSRSGVAAGKSRHRQAHGELPPARLAGVAPAALGLPDPHGPLREMRRGAGAEGKRSAGAAAGEDRFLRQAAIRWIAISAWKNTTCPACGGPAVRDTDTLDTFADSSWYFTRFSDQPCRRAGEQDGGGLLAAGGSVYRRHRTCDPASALCPLFHPRHEPSWGWSTVEEPFAGLFTQGMVCHETYQGCRRQLGLARRGRKARRQGVPQRQSAQPVDIGPSEKMSKSKKNVIAPEAIIADYGADTIRWFMLSDTPPERDIEWTDAGAEGCWRFVQRVWRLVTESEGLARAGRGTAPRTRPPSRCARPRTRPSPR